MPRDEPALKDQDVNHHANDHTPDERSEEITAGFPAGFVGELDASAATGTEAGEWAVEELPTDSALLVVTRGPKRRIAVPAGSAHHIGRSASRQRHLPRRHHRQPPARRVPPGRRAIPNR